MKSDDRNSNYLGDDIQTISNNFRFITHQLKRLRADSADERKVAEERIREEFLKQKDVEGSDWSELRTSRVQEGGSGSGRRREMDRDGDGNGDGNWGGDRTGRDTDRSRDSRNWMDSGSKSVSARGDGKDAFEISTSQDERDKRLQGEIRQLQLETVSKWSALKYDS